MKSFALSHLDFIEEEPLAVDLRSLAERASEFIIAIYQLYGSHDINYFAQIAHQELVILHCIVENICYQAGQFENVTENDLVPEPLNKLSKMMTYLENRLVFEL